MIAICATTAIKIDAQPLTVATYDQALARVEAAADNQADSPTGGQSAIAALQPVLRCTVKTQSGDLVFVDNRTILAQMQAAQQVSNADDRSDRWSDLSDEIALIRAEMPRSTASASLAPTGSARAVLTSNEFASEPLPGKSVWDKIGDAIRDWLKKLHIHTGTTAPSGSISPVVPVVLLTAIAVIAIGLIVYLISNWARNRRFDSATSPVDSGLALTFQEKELVATHNYGGLRALAQDAAARGDYRTGFRLMFVAALVYLDAEGAIKLDRSKTNWEYLRAIAANQALNEHLRPFVQDFDRIWYGLNEATSADFDHANRWYSGIQELVPVAAPAPASAAPKQVGAA